jgi:uncharacterized Zn-finger protein
MDKNLIELSAKDLNPQGGIHCPNPLAGMQVQDTHPKVYLLVAATGEAKCPYCGRVYQLKAGEHVGHAH